MKERLSFISRFSTFFWLVTFFITFSLLGLRWLASKKYGFISEDLRLWEIYLPALLSFCSVVFFVRPRFRERYNAIYIYEHNRWTKNGYFLQLLVMFFASHMLLAYSQKYFSGTFGDLIVIKSLDEVSEYPKERFFKIDSVAYNPYYGVFFEKNRRSLVSRSPKLIMNHYIVNPLYDSRIHYYKPPLIYWMGLHTKRQVSIHRLGKDNSVVKKQSNQVYEQIDTYDIDQVEFFYKTPISSLLDDYKEAIGSRYGAKVASAAVVLEPKTFPFEERSKQLLSPFLIFIVACPFLIFLLLVQKR